MTAKLSICIPTYNRASFLNETLVAFIEQVRCHDIPLYISDNSDNEETQILIEGLKKSYANITYYKNEINIGLDRNFLKVVSLANSEFVWIFGDDDLPLPNAVNEILKYIENYPDVNFFLVNSVPMLEDMKTKINENLTDLWQNEIYDDFNKFLRDISWYSTFVGAYVINKSAWDSIDAKKYIDTVFVHVGIMFEAMAKLKFKSMFISDPLILYRTGNATWASRYLLIQLTLWRSTIGLLPSEYDESSKLRAIESVVFRFVTIGALINSRISGNLNFSSMRDIVVPYYRSSSVGKLRNIKILIGSALLLITPCFILRGISALYFAYFKKIILRLIKFVRLPIFQKIYYLSNLYAIIKGRLIYKHVFRYWGSGAWIKRPSQIFNPKNISIGNLTKIEEGAILYSVGIYAGIQHHGIIIIGDGVYLNRFFNASSASFIEIGNNVTVGTNVFICNYDHGYQIINTPINNSPLVVKGGIIIGEETWLGSNVAVLGAVKIGKHCVVGTNSVVTCDIPDFSVVVGSPARIVKQYDSKNKQWIKV